jgi:hypothetical protein
MRELPKGTDKVRAHIFSMIWTADWGKDSAVADEAFRRILNSFRDRADGRELADGLTNIVDYYVVLGYWRGYRDARRHYETQLKSHKTPVDRKNAERIVLAVLRKNDEASTGDVCRALDDAGVSGGFGEEYFGARVGAKKARQGDRWVDGRSEQAVVQWVYRIRKRFKAEKLANAWLSRSSKVRPSGLAK